MRYALVSDIHANLQAWRAVLADLQSAGVDEIICLGDIVGYGPQPAQVLREVYSRVHHFVMGNHDAVICGHLDPACFNDRAAAIIDWTRRQLDRKAADVLSGFPYVIEGPEFRCAHANPVEPARFAYVIEPEAAKVVWASCPDQLVFIGHSHNPGLFVVGNSGTAHWLEPQDFRTEDHKRYIVNVGSVGQPRHADFRATYCIYDTDERVVAFRQVPFDLQGYRDALEASTLPDTSTHFLNVADASSLPSLRESLDFSPPKTASVDTADITTVRLEAVVREARRWRRWTAVLLLLCLTSVGAGVWLYAGREGVPPYTEFGAAARTTDITAPPSGAPCLMMPAIRGTVSAQNRMQHWTVRLSDPVGQRVAVETPDDAGVDAPADVGGVFRIRSEVPGELSLFSREIIAKPGMRFRLDYACREITPVTGFLELQLIQRFPDGTEHVVLHHPIQEKLGDGDWVTRYKYSHTGEDRLRREGSVRWALSGQFTGEILLHSCQLTRLD